MLNHAVLMGRLTAAPELRYTANNIPVVSFTLAVNRTYGGRNGQNNTDFIDIVAWRQQAEFVSKYFTKGQLVAVEGAIQTRTYQDRNGNNRKAVEVVAERVHFAESKNAQSSGERFIPDSPYQDAAIPNFTAPEAGQPAPSTQPAAQVFESGNFSDYEELSADDDDLPF